MYNFMHDESSNLPPEGHDAEKMTSDSGKESTTLHARRARWARRNRLQIKRLKSLSLKAEASRHFKNYDLGSASHSSAESVESGGGEESSEGRNGGLAFGRVSVMGRRRVMEDFAVAAPPVGFAGRYSFFAVYDGHGGAEVAESCCEKLHVFLEKHVEKAEKSPEEKEFDWEKVMVECFRSMDEEFAEETAKGSTALVVLVGDEEIVVANCGDSRAVIYRAGTAVPLSKDHKPDLPDEKQRIEAAGGNILNWNGWRVQGVLATSRSFGDYSLKPYVISEPEVRVTKRKEWDEFLIIATDGLWDVLCNRVACQVVKKCLAGRKEPRHDGLTGVAQAASMLVELAIARGSRDNISVIVVQLK